MKRITEPERLYGGLVLVGAYENGKIEFRILFDEEMDVIQFCCAERQDECEEDITMKWTEIDKKQLKFMRRSHLESRFTRALDVVRKQLGTKYECISECADAVSGGRRHGTVACHKEKGRSTETLFISYLITTVLMIGCAVGSAFTDDAMVWAGNDQSRADLR